MRLNPHTQPPELPRTLRLDCSTPSLFTNVQPPHCIIETRESCEDEPVHKAVPQNRPVSANVVNPSGKRRHRLLSAQRAKLC